MNLLQVKRGRNYLWFKIKRMVGNFVSACLNKNVKGFGQSNGKAGRSSGNVNPSHKNLIIQKKLRKWYNFPPLPPPKPA